LLANGFVIQHPDVNENFRKRRMWLILEPDAEPAVTFIVTFETAGCDRVSKNKKRHLIATLCSEALLEQDVFVIEHRAQPLAADVTLGRPVDRVAHGHVIGGNGLGHGAGSAADAEEPARDLLACADFSEGSITFGVEIDPKRLLVRT